MADENMENMITEVDLDDETVALILQDEEEKNKDAEPQVNEDAAAEHAKEESMQDQSQDEQADGTEVQDDDSKETKPDGVPRLFIGGLFFNTQDKEFREHFEKYGELKECYVVEAKNRHGPQSKKKPRTKGYGFVTMSTVEETEAILKDTHVINNKVVSVVVSTPKDAPQRRLRIGLSGMDKEKTTKESLMAHFSQFGNVKQCSINMEQVDGKTVSQGIGFVDMATEEEMQAVLNGNVDGYQMIDEKSVLVKLGVIGGKNHNMLCKLWFGGLDREKTTEADVLELFSPFGTVKESILIRDPPTKEGGECRSKGYGFIVMENIRETNAVLKHSKEHRLHGKLLVFNRTLQNQDFRSSSVPVKSPRGKGSTRGGQNTSRNSDRRKASASRDDVLYGSNVGNYHRPSQGGSFQYEDDYYGEDASSYGPMRGPVRRAPPGGGWVFVDDIYGQPDDSFHSTQGFRSQHYQSSSQDPQAMGGGHGNRNKRRGRGRPY